MKPFRWILGLSALFALAGTTRADGPGLTALLLQNLFAAETAPIRTAQGVVPWMEDWNEYTIHPFGSSRDVAIARMLIDAGVNLPPDDLSSGLCVGIVRPQCYRLIQVRE